MKANEWKILAAERPVYTLGNPRAGCPRQVDVVEIAKVSDDGGLFIVATGVYTSDVALSFARWVLDTFDEKKK